MGLSKWQAACTGRSKSRRQGFSNATMKKNEMQLLKKHHWSMAGKARIDNQWDRNTKNDAEFMEE
jgi:hypothetical protein